MLIKVCGLREADNIRAVEALGVDWVGFIFWPQSKRYAGRSGETAARTGRARRVGVFVDAERDTILHTAERFRLDGLQLHGHESADFIVTLRQSFEGFIIKALNVATEADLSQTKTYEGVVDYLLFDTKGKSIGGNGTQYDWNILQAYQGKTPFLLSGGIGPDDARRVSQFSHPRLAGIDLNSRFELAPGLKDIQKLTTFLTQLR